MVKPSSRSRLASSWSLDLGRPTKTSLRDGLRQPRPSGSSPLGLGAGEKTEEGQQPEPQPKGGSFCASREPASSSSTARPARADQAQVWGGAERMIARYQ